jgi:hypothetical protein
MELLLWAALVIDGVILLAVLVKWRAVAVASKWPSAKGRIITSDTQARKVSRIADSEDMVQIDEIRNFASIGYAFNVGKRKFHGTRIHLGEDPGNVRLAETLKRYPRGAEVAVYYDPSNPKNCVLDRDPPTEGFFATAIGTTVVVAVGLVAMLLASNGILAGLSLPEPRWTPASVGIVCLLALGLVLIAAARRHRHIMRHWRTTPGTILSSDAVKLKKYDKWLSPSSYFRASTTYEYVVDGMRYVSDRIGFGEGVFSNQRIFARRDAGRFHPGMSVEVLYDPDNPASAILVKPRTGWRAAQ